jgi:hypothetical protein
MSRGWPEWDSHEDAEYDAMPSRPEPTVPAKVPPNVVPTTTHPESSQSPAAGALQLGVN